METKTRKTPAQIKEDIELFVALLDIPAEDKDGLFKGLSALQMAHERTNREMLEALQEAEKALTHEYWMTGESAVVVRAAIDKSPHIIKIRAAIKKATE